MNAALMLQARSTRLRARSQPDSWRDLWLRTAIRGTLLVVTYFSLWEIAEKLVLLRGGYNLHTLHIMRGMGAAFLLSTWSFFQVRRSRLESDRTIAQQMSLLEERVKERTAELEEARAFTELLFNSLRERIVVLDPDGRVVKANRVANDLAGQPLVGRLCRDVFPGCTPSGTPVLEDRADAQGRLWELESITVPGRDLTIEVGRDVTEQRSLEAQVRHQEKMASLGVLAAGFAHDLGNPLASLSTELELLEGEDDVLRFRESAGVLRRHVSRMSRTLREMVDFARRRRDEVTDVSIALAVDDSARLVCHDPRWKRIQLVVDIPHDLPSVRMVDDHLVLVLVNLMLNAADAMPNGGSLTVSARERDHGKRIELRLRDTGVGMAPDVLAKALTPLFTTKTHGRGTGLGLAVSSSIVRSVGGSLRLESTEGAGTDVIIELPGGGQWASGS
jgi:C4-dicarboxylate-specific signal transduction histidine kinase